MNLVNWGVGWQRMAECGRADLIGQEELAIVWLIEWKKGIEGVEGGGGIKRRQNDQCKVDEWTCLAGLAGSVYGLISGW